MYHPDPSTTDTPLDHDHEALKLLSFYTLVASLVPNSNLPSITPQSPKSTHFSSSSAPSETPKMKITIDTSTTIIGHGNTIQLPSPATTNERIQSLLEIACRHLPDRSAADDEEVEYGDEGYAPPGAMDVEIRLNAGVNICGSKNVVLLGGGGCVRSGQVQGQGVKRKAEGVSN